MSFFVVDLDDTLVNTTRDLRGDFDNMKSLTLVEGARAFLARHGDKSVILSFGLETRQQQKIDVVGVRTLVRQVVIVPTHAQKERTLAKFAGARTHAGCEVVVVGDRVDQEIRMANALNLTTVRMRLPDGKYYGAQPLDPLEKPDFTVGNFSELMKLPLKF